MIYFEFSEHVARKNGFPSTVCCMNRPEHTIAVKTMLMSLRVYSVEGNMVREIKNKTGMCSTTYISDEDKIVLRLRAVEF